MFNQEQNTKDLGKRAQRFLKENDILLRKYKLTMRLVVSFPRLVKAPLLSRIALKIVAKQGGKLDIQFSEKG